MEAGSGFPGPQPSSRRGLLWGAVVAVVVLAIAGTVAILWMRSGEERIIVPDLVGMQQTEAEEVLAEAGLELGDVSRVAVDTETAEANTVLSQAPSAGTEVDPAAEVALVVAEAYEEAGAQDSRDKPPAQSNPGSGSATKAEPKRAATKEGPPQAGEIADDQGWTSMPFMSSGKGPYLSPPFGINSSRIMLGVDIHSPQTGELTFDLLEAGDPSRSVLHWVVPVTSKPTDHSSAPVTVPVRDDYRLRIEVSPNITSPQDVVWSVGLFEQLP